MPDPYGFGYWWVSYYDGPAEARRQLRVLYRQWRREMARRKKLGLPLTVDYRGRQHV